MKYSKNAITQLKRQYKSVLLKCALINAALFMAAAPAMAEFVDVGETRTIEVNENKVLEDPSDTYINGTLINKGTLNKPDNGEHYAVIVESIEGDSPAFVDNQGTFTALHLRISTPTAQVDNTGTISTGRLDNYGIFNNKQNSNITISGTEDYYSFSSYNYGSLNNSGTILLDGVSLNQDYDYDNEAYWDSDDNYIGPRPQLINSGTITRTVDVNNGIIANSTIENYRGLMENTESGVINADIRNQDEFINAGTIQGAEGFGNEGMFTNTGTVKGGLFFNTDHGYTTNKGDLHNLITNNSGSMLRNQKNLKTHALQNYRGTIINDSAINLYSDLTFDDYKEIISENVFEAMITDAIQDYSQGDDVSEEFLAMTDEQKRAFVIQEFEDNIDSEFGPGAVLNQGVLLNGVGVAITADNQDVTEEYLKDTLNPVISIAPVDEEPEIPDVVEWKFSGSTGTIKGDILNGSMYGDFGPLDAIRTRFPTPFNSSEIVWNNDTIEGDIFNNGMIVNGVEYTRTIDNTGSKNSDADFVLSDVTATFGAVSNAIVKSDAIFNYGGTIINGGQIEAKVILNNFRLDNGWISPDIAAGGSYGSPEAISIGEADLEDLGSDSYSEPEAVVMPNASIVADTIYNSGFIHNAGTITGNIINFSAWDEDDDIYLYGPSSIAMHNATIEGDISSQYMDGEEFDELWAGNFKKFEDMFSIRSEDDEFEDDDTESSNNEWDDLFGSMQTFEGDNTVTGSVKIGEVMVRPNTSLTIGGPLMTHYLAVGTESDDDYLGIASDDEQTTTETSVPARLDIGANVAQVGDAYFGADSVLALTVKNENEYGQMFASDFYIQEGAKLEVTVLPGFSDNEEHELQLLAIDDNLMTSKSDDDISSPNGEGEGGLSLEEGDGDEDSSKDFNKFTDSFIDAEGEDVIANNMFEIKRVDDEGNYSFKQIKKAEDIIDPTPIPAPKPKSELSGMAKAWLDDGLMTTPGSLETQTILANLAQHHSRKEFADTLKGLAPNDAPMAQAVATAVMGHIFGGISAHLSKPKSGLSSGDALNGVSFWGSTYYGNSKLDDRADEVYGFDADSKGITAGVDKQVTSSVKLGLGLQYDKSDINAFKRDVDVETAAVFGYGEYRPNNWYVSGVAAYGRSDYDEKKFVDKKTIKANYKADLFGLQGMTGYDVITRYADITPNAGLRYNYIKRHGYEDGANQKISGSNSDILTGVVGLKVAKNFGGFRPSAYVNFTYDMVSDREKVTIGLPNGSGYTVSGKRLNQFGTEAGVALEYNYNNWTVSANYDYAGRKHFNSHTGMLTAKYSF